MTTLKASIMSALKPTKPSTTESPTVSINKRIAMQEAAKSKKTGLAWGPSHSVDSDDSSHKKQTTPTPEKRQQQQASPGTTETTKTSSTGSEEDDDIIEQERSVVAAAAAPTNLMGRFLENAAAVVGFQQNDHDQVEAKRLIENDSLMDRHGTLADSMCNPCNGALQQPHLNICFFPPQDEVVPSVSFNHAKTSTISLKPKSLTRTNSSSSSTPADRRRQRHAQRALQEQAKQNLKPTPMDTLELDSNYSDIERSISELTMKSSYGEATAKLAENRRMAYYAVGKHHRHNSGRGGNRRCYFTGKLILGGAPFYAGSVQQGLRTLVVFCLPSAVGLPKMMERTDSQASGTTSLPPSIMRSASKESGISVVPSPTKSSASTTVDAAAAKLGIIKRLRTRSRDTTGSRLSSLYDDMSLSIVEEDLDPNWGLDRDYLLQHLPEPNEDLLKEMEERYPEQFETLPIQVRSPHCWRLFVKFCFFSGLPIAEGESHYKVRDEVAMEVYGEEIILSHDVMEAVNGESAEILRLPNQKTFRYLRKHYTQQSSKLSDAVFCRRSWELVRPEI